VRTEQDLIEALRQQFELLKIACLAYDNGNELEAINIATRLRVILQGPGSLIGQLRLSKELKFRDTATHRLDDPNRNICVANIGVKIMVGVGTHWIPLLEAWPEDHLRAPSQRFTRCGGGVSATCPVPAGGGTVPAGGGTVPPEVHRFTGLLHDAGLLD
jgi:hypothetical protein